MHSIALMTHCILLYYSLRESGPTTRTKGVRPRTEARYARFSRTALEPTLWAVKKGQTCVHGTSCLH